VIYSVKFETELRLESLSKKEMIGLSAAHVLLIIFVVIIGRFQKETFDSAKVAKLCSWISYCKNAVVEGEKMTEDYLNS
jgi:hypothetical protein